MVFIIKLNEIGVDVFIFNIMKLYIIFCLNLIISFYGYLIYCVFCFILLFDIVVFEGRIFVVVCCIFFKKVIFFENLI